MLDNTERPNVEERYITAAVTSDLRVEADRAGAGDVMVAAGWNQSRVGMALLRLHSEWSACAKPRRPSLAQLEAIADTIREDDAKAKKAADIKGAPYKAPGSAKTRAREMADRWYASELRLLAVGLKSRANVWEQMEIHGKIINTPPDVVAAALLHWLNPTCPVCDGHGLRKVPDQPALSARQCHKCHGAGHVHPPSGTARVLEYIDICIIKARQSLKHRLSREG